MKRYAGHIWPVNGFYSLRPTIQVVPSEKHFVGHFKGPGAGFLTIRISGKASGKHCLLPQPHPGNPGRPDR